VIGRTKYLNSQAQAPAVSPLKPGKLLGAIRLTQVHNMPIVSGRLFNDAVNIAARGLIMFAPAIAKSGGDFYDFQLDAMGLTRGFLDRCRFR
jgi:hypothetical protein